MTTPKKEAVYAESLRLWKNDLYKHGYDQLGQNNPTEEELKQNGCWSQSVSELMRSEDSEYKAHIEREARNLNLIKERYEDLEVKELAEVFDLNETLASGVYISGTSGHGKSDLAMYLSDLLREHGVIVIVIDSSQDWLARSAISYVQTVLNPNQVSVPEQSLIMDISLLSIGERQTFAENLCRELYEHQAKTPKQLRKEIFIVFEESHVYLTEGTLRSKKFQNITRLLTEGRNYNIRFMCITQFASLISKVAIKFMRLRFFGYADEPNDLKFISGFLGREHVKRLRTLEHGSFIHYASGNLSLVHVEPYASTTPKSSIQQPNTPMNTQPTNQSINIIPIAKLFILLGFAVLVLYSLRGM